MLYVLTASLIGFAFSVVLTLLVLHILRRRKIGQKISEDAPQRHQQKEGTPTMGGIALVLSACLGYWVIGGKDPRLPLALLGFALVGLIDDLLSVHKKRSLGLPARWKFFLQCMLSILLLLNVRDISPLVHFPGGGWHLDLGILYPFFALLLLVGFSNATNLTDGLDGLSAGCTAIVAGGMALVAIYLKDIDIGLFLASLSGACLGFLWFNFYPAKIIMGDTGALALGGALAFASILMKEEITLILMGLVFIAETLSVILQVISFKTRKKRIFRMTPLHHHFELMGWEEPLITFRFWLVSLLLIAFNYLWVVRGSGGWR